MSALYEVCDINIKYDDNGNITKLILYFNTTNYPLQYTLFKFKLTINNKDYEFNNVNENTTALVSNINKPGGSDPTFTKIIYTYTGNSNPSGLQTNTLDNNNLNLVVYFDNDSDPDMNIIGTYSGELQIVPGLALGGGESNIAIGTAFWGFLASPASDMASTNPRNENITILATVINTPCSPVGAKLCEEKLAVLKFTSMIATAVIIGTITFQEPIFVII